MRHLVAAAMLQRELAGTVTDTRHSTGLTGVGLRDVTPIAIRVQTAGRVTR